jgi:hypothetical protein
MFMIILKILAGWTIVSFVTFVSAVCVIRFLKRNPANHLPPLPEGSILGKHSERVF